MKVEFLDGPALADKIVWLAHRSHRLDIAMAYVKIGGLRTIQKGIDSLIEKNGLVRIVFGLSTRHSITDKISAKALLELSKNDKVLVKKWDDPGFHPKLMIFYGNPISIVVGSANLTVAAQSGNAEANILIEDPEPKLLKDTETFFSYYFDPASLLKRKDVQKYEKHYSKKVLMSSYKSLDEDNMPSPMQRKHGLSSIRLNNVWKIAPGRDANCWKDEWLQTIDEDGEGVVAIG